MAKVHNALMMSSGPHLVSSSDSAVIYRDTVIALLPQLLVSIYMFGFRAFIMTAACMAASVIFEWAFRRILGRSRTIGDWSAAASGMLLAFTLSVRLPYWMAIVGCFISIVVVKQLFGGIGQYFANPVAVAKLILLVSFPDAMNNWSVGPHMSEAIRSAAGIDAVTGPMPLDLFAAHRVLPSDLDMFLGRVNGALGEISGLALIIGGIYLIVRKDIDPLTPASFILSAAAAALVLGLDPIFHIFAGGIMLGAFFIATDMPTSPITRKGRLIYGIGCGVLTMLIRVYSNYSDGTAFAILLMNILSPLIDRAVMRVPGKEAAGE